MPATRSPPATVQLAASARRIAASAARSASARTTSAPRAWLARSLTTLLAFVGDYHNNSHNTSLLLLNRQQSGRCKDRVHRAMLQLMTKQTRNAAPPGAARHPPACAQRRRCGRGRIRNGRRAVPAARLRHHGDGDRVLRRPGARDRGRRLRAADHDRPGADAGLQPVRVQERGVRARSTDCSTARTASMST